VVVSCDVVATKVNKREYTHPLGTYDLGSTVYGEEGKEGEKASSDAAQSGHTHTHAQRRKTQKKGTNHCSSV